MQRTLTVDYGDNVLLALGLSEDEFSEEAKSLLAVKLYELGRLSSGAALHWPESPIRCSWSRWETMGRTPSG